MKTKFLTIVATLILGVAGAHAATLDELKAKQYEKEMADMDADIAKAKASAKPQTLEAPRLSVPSGFVGGGSRSDRQPALLSVFGVGDVLRADILIKGTKVTMRQGDTVLGMQLLSLATYEAKLKDVKTKKIITLSLESSDSSVFSSTSTPMTSTSLPAPGSLPPVPGNPTFR